MILLVHMLFGAAVSSYIKNPFLAVILAFFSHYVLDLIPHIEYNIENIKKAQWDKSLLDILKVASDFLIGVLFIFLFLGWQLIIFIVVFFAILPDGLTVLSYFFQNKFLELHKKFHQKKIHFLRDNPSASFGTAQDKGSRQIKISNFWRITNQVLIIIISIFLLKI